MGAEACSGNKNKKKILKILLRGAALLKSLESYIEY
jgi:hypothetical protein